MVYRPWTSPSTSLSYAALNALIGCLLTVRILYAIDPVEVLDLHFRWSGDRSDLGESSSLGRGPLLCASCGCWRRRGVRSSS